jgi:alpha-tubulin suppressor-like RCC1 family protein
LRRFVAALAVLMLIPASSAFAQVKQWGSFFGAASPFTQAFPTVVGGLENVTSVDASNTSAYFLESNGTVWAIGDNNNGQLGDGGTEASTTPVQVQLPAGTDVTSLGEAGGTGYAVTSTGHGFVWGAAPGGSSCLGPHMEQILTPTEVPAIDNAVAVQGGEDHVLWLLKDGTVKTCGQNVNGELGLGTEGEGRSRPRSVVGLSDVVEISAGNRNSCALTRSGEVYEWGFNDEGQIGAGSTAPNFDSPVHIPLPGPASEISCGGDLVANSHTLTLVNGEVFGWGCDGKGQVGDGGSTNKLSPVATGLHFSRVVASGVYSLGLDAEGNVWAWGSGEGDSLGTGNTRKALVPVMVDSGATGISATARDSLDF